MKLIIEKTTNVMVGLLKKTKSSLGNQLKNNMKDTNEEEAEYNTEKQLSNGSGKDMDKPEVEKESVSAEPEDEKMDVEEENAKKDPFEVNEEEDNEASEDTTQPRDTRSSHSQSSDSVLSTRSNQNNFNNKGKDFNETDDEDFLGFESTNEEHRRNYIDKLREHLARETSKDIEAESSLVNSDNSDSEDEQFNEKASVSDVMDATSFDNSNMDSVSVDNDSNSGPNSASARKGVRGSKKSVSVDLSNPEFRKPFEYGWIRELVYRSTSDNSVKRNADVYYYTPSGKKVRSSREILEHLTGGGELTIENFSFFKEPLGLDDSTKEIIREAKSKPGPRLVTEDATPSKKVSTPKLKSSSSTPKITPKETPKTNTSTPKVVFKGFTSKSRTPTSSIKAKSEKPRKSAGPDDVDIIMDSPDWSPESKDPKDVCSVYCRLAMGLVPSIKCIHCLCMYHPECIGLEVNKMKPSQIEKYICKNCLSKKKSAHSSRLLPPPSDPMLPEPARTNVTTSQSIFTTSSPAVSASSIIDSKPGIVGGLTTWIAPSSHVQVTPQAEAYVPPTHIRQGLCTLRGREFLYLARQTNVNNSPSRPTDGVSGGGVSNEGGLILVPCDPSQQQDSRNRISPISQSSVPLTNGLKRANESPRPDSTSTAPEKRAKLSKSRDRLLSNKTSPPIFMDTIGTGFNTLLNAFQYLKVYELLRASRVSKFWNYVASHPSLWETVRMKNSRVSDWNGFAKRLNKQGTQVLDLRKMLVPEEPRALNDMWMTLCSAVHQIKSIVKVDMGRCSPAAFYAMADAAPQLRSLISLAIKGSDLDLGKLKKMEHLEEFKLKAVSGILNISDLGVLNTFSHLQHLALTTIKDLKDIDDSLPEGLVTLELGECSTLRPNFAVKLTKLNKLKRLRLEKGQGICPTMEIVESISTLQNLKQLELINFDIKPGFEKVLSKCTNLEILLIIPTYVTQSATTNHVVMGGVAKLSSSLKCFIWGLTLELLKVTDLFIGQVESQQKTAKTFSSAPSKKGTGDSIPILKPSSDVELKEGSQTPSQVDILALPNLQRVLSTLLPTTKIKILKVPFSATWRQTVNEAL